MSQWLKARQKLVTDSPGSTRKGSHDLLVEGGENAATLERADPELCITLMERRLNFSGLKHRLRTADQVWIEQFLAIGGLSAIFDALEALGQKGFNSIADALRQLECVGCVKAVMNNRFGLEFIILQPGEGFVKKLAQVLDTNNGLVKTQIFELLSALCLYSEDGYQLALDALDDYKRSKNQRYRFSLLSQELRESETQEYSACVLAFINCILAGATDLSKRVKLRNEFIGLQLQEILSRWRHTADEALATQIEVFEDSYSEDESQLTMPGGVDINSHEDMFNAVLAKVFNTPHELPFLHILQSLLLLDRNAVKSAAIWELLEEFCQKAVIIDNPDAQADKLKSIGIEKLRTILQEEQNRKKKEADLPAPPPPPPPPGGIGIPAPPPPPPPPGGVGVPVPPPPPPPPGGVGVPAPPPPPPPPGGVGIPAPPPLPFQGGPGIPPPPPPPFAPGGVPPPPPFPGGIPAPPPIPGAPPFPGGAPPPPPIPGGVPQPPGFPGYASVAAMAVKMTKIERARKHKPKKQMKKVNWVKLSKNAASDTGAVWHKSAKGEEDIKVDIDPESVEDMFARPEIKKAKKDGEDKEKEKQPSVVTLLDQKTNLNVNIFLKQFKTDNASIVTMIRDGDSSKLSIDQLKALEKLLPDSAIIEMLKSFSGDRSKLGTGEDFFIRLLEVKQFPLRIEAMQLRMEFGEKLEDLRPAIATLEQVIDELLGCDMLRDILEVVLTAGNIINGGGRAGDAYGITVSSLNKLKDTKSRIPRLSLLHYISQVCEEQAPNLLGLSEQLPTLEKASRLSHEFLSGEVSQLSTKVKQLEKKCKKSPDDLKAQLKTFLGEAHQTLDDLQASLKTVNDKIKSAAHYFCQDTSKFKLEELIQELLTFVKDFSNAKKENDQRRQLEEKRKKREEAKRAAQEAKRKKMAAKGIVPDNEPEEPKEETCVIDNLLKEIRTGTSLRRTGRSSVHHKRRTSQLNKGDLEKLTQIVEQAATTPRKLSPAASKEPQFSFPVLAEEDSNINGAKAPQETLNAVQNGGGEGTPTIIVRIDDSSDTEMHISHSQDINGEAKSVQKAKGENTAISNGDAMRVVAEGGNGDSGDMDNKASHVPKVDGLTSTNSSSNVVRVNGPTTTEASESRSQDTRDKAKSVPKVDGLTSTNSCSNVVRVNGPTTTEASESRSQDTRDKAKSVPKVGTSEASNIHTSDKANCAAKAERESKTNSSRGNTMDMHMRVDGPTVKEMNNSYRQSTNGETVCVPVANGESTPTLKVKAKSALSDHRASDVTVPPKPKASSPMVGDIATDSPSLPTASRNDTILNQEKTKTVTNPDQDTEMLLKKDQDRLTQSEEASENSLQLMSPSEDPLYQQLVERMHSHDISSGLASALATAMLIVPSRAEKFDPKN